MRFFLLILALIIVMPTFSMALEPKKIEVIDINEMLSETQIPISNSGGLHIVWWIPLEFWKVALSQNNQLSSEHLNYHLELLNDYFMVGVVQADISPIGAFRYYDEATVLSGMDIRYVDQREIIWNMKPMETLPEDLVLMQSQIKPILTAAMGNMGGNFHFFTYRNTTQDDGNLIVSPYKNGQILINLKNKNGTTVLSQNIALPLNSLFIPRICPNGKPAHISWNFCPWSGEKLTEVKEPD